jgi:hypothetical protein
LRLEARGHDGDLRFAIGLTRMPRLSFVISSNRYCGFLLWIADCDGWENEWCLAMSAWRVLDR